MVDGLKYGFRAVIEPGWYNESAGLERNREKESDDRNSGSHLSVNRDPRDHVNESAGQRLFPADFLPYCVATYLADNFFHPLTDESLHALDHNFGIWMHTKDWHSG